MAEREMRVAGFGFRSGASLATLRHLLQVVEAKGGRADALASVPEKASAPVMQSLSTDLGLPLRAVSVDGIATPTQSLRVKSMLNTGSVAEAAALAAAGPGATLSVLRIVAADGTATCAMAETKGPTE